MLRVTPSVYSVDFSGNVSFSFLFLFFILRIFTASLLESCHTYSQSFQSFKKTKTYEA